MNKTKEPLPVTGLGPLEKRFAVLPPLPRWQDTVIQKTAWGEATDPIRCAMNPEKSVFADRDWHRRASSEFDSLYRPALQRELDRLSRQHDEVKLENRQFAGDNTNFAKFFGKGSELVSDALSRFAVKHDVASPWWRMLRDLLTSSKAAKIQDLDEGTYKMADYLVGRMCSP